MNPSYDWLYALSRYCRSEGNKSTVQVAFVSSYAAIRLWKVLYKDGSCYIDADSGGTHLCRNDVAVGFDLDPARNIPPSLGATAQACMANAEFNLLVESVEYYDDLNIVVAVRRGTVQDLPNLMEGIPAGHMVFYFVNTLNLTLIREHTPWTPVPPPSVLAGSGVLCPALRFLPSLGTFFSKSAAAVFQGFRFLLNLFTNPFALLEVIRARTAGLCPTVGLHHSALDDCGMGLFHLDDFFRSLYAANIAFWDLLAWIASLFTSSSSTISRYFESFLMGAASYGEASQIVSLYEVTDLASNLLDTGIQDSLLGRRRLLSYDADADNTNQTGAKKGGRKLMGFKMELAKGVGGGILSGLWSLLTGPFTKTFSMSQSLTSTMMLRATSADYSVLLNMQNPTYMLSSAVTAPSIAWAHFSFLTMVPIGLDLAGMLLSSYASPENTPDFFMRSLAVVWVNLFEAKDHYEALVATRLQHGCQVRSFSSSAK